MVTAFKAPETAPETVTTHSRVLAIHINSACDWNRLPLQETVTHEYGHALGLWNYHSQDKRSVMYPMPMRGQVIMREDRAALVAVAGQGR
jgi:predicted Zn-dependent protease